MKSKATIWYVYLIEAEGRPWGGMGWTKYYYCGITIDLQRRFDAHKNGTGAKFFSRGNKVPLKIAYTEEYPDRSSASKREYEIKQLSHAEKKKLCGK